MQKQLTTSSSFNPFKKGGMFGAKVVEKPPPEPVALDTKPDSIRGWLEKKNHSAGLSGGNWARRYFIFSL